VLSKLNWRFSLASHRPADKGPLWVEWLMNHLHFDGIQHIGCPDISKDKLAMLGKVLKEIYEAKLQ
jgi:hypothetical protein